MQRREELQSEVLSDVTTCSIEKLILEKKDRNLQNTLQYFLPT